MGHYVVYLSQSLDPRVLQRKASEVSAMLDLTTEQVHHLLEQAPGKVTHPTSLERAEHIEHIFEHAGIYAEVREVEESFAEGNEHFHKEASIASQMIEHSLSVLDERNRYHKPDSKEPEAQENFDTLPLSAFGESIDDKSLRATAPEGFIDADAVYPQNRRAGLTQNWVQRARALSLLLLLLLFLMSLLWWRNHNQTQNLMYYNAQQ